MRKFFTLLFSILLTNLIFSQISVSASVSENFDAMGTTLTLPSNWRMGNSTSSPTWATGATSVTQQASSGSPTAGGTYNFGTSSSERSIGAMTSGGFASPNNPMVFFNNGGSSNITQLSVDYDAERYRVNTAIASIEFFYSLNGTAWISVPAGDIASSSFPTGASSYSFIPGLTINKTNILITGLNIVPTGNFYLRWNIITTGTNSQAISIDNFSMTPTFAPLPIEMSHFKVNSDTDKNIISFTTTSETNNDYFTIERSGDGSNFDAIGMIDGAGNSSRAINYAFTDEKPLAGVNYYRIKQTDFDGQYSYSEIKSVRHSGLNNVSVSPRTTEGNLNIISDLEHYNLSVYSVSGQEIKTFKNLSLDQSISIDELKSGLYFIKIYSGSDTETIKIVKI